MLQHRLLGLRRLSMAVVGQVLSMADLGACCLVDDCSCVVLVLAVEPGLIWTNDLRHCGTWSDNSLRPNSNGFVVLLGHVQVDHGSLYVIALSVLEVQRSCLAPSSICLHNEGSAHVCRWELSNISCISRIRSLLQLVGEGVHEDVEDGDDLLNGVQQGFWWLFANSWLWGWCSPVSAATSSCEQQLFGGVDGDAQLQRSWLHTWVTRKKRK